MDRSNIVPMFCVALIHFPTIDKTGTPVTTSVTNFDIHDIARASRTYGVDRYYIVTPSPMQQAFTKRVLTFWRTGEGKEYNPTRGQALEEVRVVGDLAEIDIDLQKDTGRSPMWVATSAKPYPHSIACSALREKIDGPEPIVLMFGTGYGLHPQVIEEADAILRPINGPTPWNHLSVRSAVSIYLDRLLAERED